MSGIKVSRRTMLAALGLGATTALSGCGGGSDDDDGLSSSSSERLDKVLEEAVAAEDAPFLVAAVSDRNGVIWQGAAGQANASLPASQDVVFAIFSATKAIGSLAAMILLDRGQVTLETKVADVLPEYGAFQVLESIGPSGPVLRPPATPVTLRQLLTHTNGQGYALWNQKQLDFQNSTTPPTPGGYDQPLMFDPGTGWTYGTGIDWAGFMVEKIDGRSIDQFVQEEIFGPLHMNDTVFEKDSVASRLAMPRSRGEDGKFTDSPGLGPEPRPERYGMGGCLYGTTLDYLKFLRLVLNDGVVDERRILSSNAVKLMKENQIGSLRIPFPTVTTNPATSAGLDLFPGAGVPCTHTSAFVRNEIDVPERRRAGSLTWAGLANTHYWVDPASGIAAVLFSQHLPFIEPRFVNVYATFEKAVYRELSRD